MKNTLKNQPKTANASELTVGIIGFLFVCLIVCLVSFGFCQNIDISKEIENLKSSTASVRLDAIRKLGGTLTEDIVKVLVEHLLKEEDNYLKVEIMEILSVSGSTVAFSVISSQLKSQNPYIRKMTVVSLSKFDEELSFPVLKKIFKEEKEKSVKLAVVDAFKNYKNREVVELLDEVLLDSDEQRDVKMLAVKTLAKIDTPDSKKVLIKYRYHKDIEIKKLVETELKLIEKKK